MSSYKKADILWMSIYDVVLYTHNDQLLYNIIAYYHSTIGHQYKYSVHAEVQFNGYSNSIHAVLLHIII